MTIDTQATSGGAPPTTARDTEAKVLLVDDHPIVRHGLQRLINAEPGMAVCGEAPDASSALRAIEEMQPHVVLLDLSLGSGDGLELIKQIRSRGWTPSILVLSMYGESAYAERVLAAGAQGYVMKQESPETVLEGIHKVLDGHIFLSDAMQQRVLHKAAGGVESHRMDPIDTLSDRELEVFKLIGIGRSTRRIAEQLHLSVKTVETYRANIKAKLSVTDAAELLQRAQLWVRDIRG